MPVITVRLREAEVEHLDKMAASEITGCENRSEFIRLLLAREWNRRKGLEKPRPGDYQTAHRTGRPSKANNVDASDAEKKEAEPDHK